MPSNPLFEGYQNLREMLGKPPWTPGNEDWREPESRPLTKRELLKLGLSERDASFGNLLVESRMREMAIKRFGFAIPNEEALAAIAAHGPIVELGAGLGYWASLLLAREVDIFCLDQHPAGPGSKNTYAFKHSEPFVNVRQGSFEVLKDGFKAATLLLIWPDYSSSFADDCLTAYRGDTVIYVGEGVHGCTGDDTFHARLEFDWHEIQSVAIPQWWGIHDYLRVFKRGAPDDQVVPAECGCSRWGAACLYCWRKGLTESQKVEET